MDINLADDFAAVVDDLASVTLVRASGGQLVVSGARCVSAFTTTDDESGGGVLRHDAVWDLPWPVGEPPPEIGDRIEVDAESCVVLSIQRLTPGVRYRCDVRALEINPNRGELVQVQQAVWEDLGLGPEITGWTTLLADVLACVQPMAIEVDRGGESPTSTYRYRVYLDTDTELDHNHRIQGADGALYQVERFTSAERVDALPMVEATLVLSE